METMLLKAVTEPSWIRASKQEMTVVTAMAYRGTVVREST